MPNSVQINYEIVNDKIIIITTQVVNSPDGSSTTTIARSVPFSKEELTVKQDKIIEQQKNQKTLFEATLKNISSAIADPKMASADAVVNP